MDYGDSGGRRLHLRFCYKMIVQNINIAFPLLSNDLLQTRDINDNIALDRTRNTLIAICNSRTLLSGCRSSCVCEKNEQGHESPGLTLSMIYSVYDNHVLKTKRGMRSRVYHKDR